MNGDIQIEQLVKLVKSRLLDTESKFKLLIELIENAHLENELLNISTFEKIRFHLNSGNIVTNATPSVERLSLVLPPSYECTIAVCIEGYYMVKYPSSNVELPMKLDAFIIDYNFILVRNQEIFQFKHEQIKLSEK